ncbi:glycosyltransferase family 39 protein [Zunongwangia sp. F363]|uniref:Glycosyltransferase family 39 protein n=1 Tax=Autumnicola tepida TaxID=3075595 RepID=A0ABU3C9S9_9FLAO|nr:glycosyltransferase family 39 protein [Zunongwangia sp. F363]MDT0643095.1 glycosyltransferase family 39 protein [Zunongwangia sp. F363]
MDRTSINYSIGIVLFLLIAINFPGLTESSEARYAEIGMEMYKSGDVIHPRLLGILHFHKPPLTYVITSLGYQIFGVNEFGARFFLVLAVAIQMYLVYQIAWELYRNISLSRLAIVIYASLPLVLISVLNLTTDAYLNTFVLGSIYCYLRHFTNKKKIYHYLIALLLALGVLTKGPVAFLPFLIFVTLHKYYSKSSWKIGFHEIAATIFCLLLATSWFALIISEKPELWTYFINHHIKDRVMNAEVFHREENFWYYLAFIPLLCFPFFYIITYQFFTSKDKSARPDKIITWTIILNLFAFSCFSSKLILYLLPSAPFVAIMAAKILTYGSNKLHRFTKNIILVEFFTIGFSGCIYLFLNSFYLLSSVLVLVLVAILAWNSRTKAVFTITTGNIGLMMLLVYLFVSFGFNKPSAIHSYKNIFEEAEKSFPNSSTLLVYDQLIPSARIYTNKNVITIHNKNFRSNRETQFEPGEMAANYLDIANTKQVENLKQKLANPETILMIKQKDLESLPVDLGEYKPKKTKIGEWYFYSN